MDNGQNACYRIHQHIEYKSNVMSCQSRPKRSHTAIGPSDAPDISLSSREHEFSASSWWLVDIESDDVITQGATPLVKRCMRVYDWDLAKTRRVLSAYRQFLFLKNHYEDWDATQLSPSYLIDQMWHQHILDVTNYCHDMMLLCGHVVGHNPDGALDVGGKKTRDMNIRIGLRDHFRDRFDREIWGIPRANGDEPVVIRVRDQSGEETFFTVKARTRMGKIFEAYASRKGVNAHTFTFLLDGDDIEHHETPFTLELEDQDQIDAVLYQCGC